MELVNDMLQIAIFAASECSRLQKVKKVLTNYKVDKRLESCKHEIESLNKHNEKLFKSIESLNTGIEVQLPLDYRDPRL